MYLDAQGQPTHRSVVGALAAGIPGTVAGMAMAHERFGKLAWSDLVAPAVALAQGHVVDEGHAAALIDAAERMRKAGFESTAKLYAGADGTALAPGDTWRQPELAATLQLIGAQGAAAFYAGPLAEHMAREVRALGGVWQIQDLAAYRAVPREPLRFAHLGHEVITMPPPSAGGIVLRQMLYASESLRLRELPWQSVLATHLYAEAARRAFADRSHWVSDPDKTDVPTAQLIDPQYIATRMRGIDAHHATPSSEVAPGNPLARSEPTETTHFSVVDAAGNAVANTYTLNGSFGALLAIPGTGILLNNEMDDFASRPGTPNLYGLIQGERNAIAPGKRMLSSMTPTVLVKDGKLRAVLGSPGGPTITTTVAQLVMALVDHGRTLPEAVRAARVHHQWLPDRITVEAAVDPALVSGLQALGHAVEPYGASIGHAHCIEVDPLTGGLRAVADVTRGDGAAAAY
jgi:gamma-glutamyltranspeptidase/glutathione hydrolase